MSSPSSFHCRSCGSSDLSPILSLGRTPLADRLLTREELDQPEPMEALDLVLCDQCSLVQITETVAPEILFSKSYPYFSSVSKSLCEHFASSARAIMTSRALGSDSLVVEAASNDGCMLRNFAARNIPVLGIDPAAAPVAKARASGIPTLETFFTNALAEKLVAEGKQADVFLANNVLAHVADLNGFVSGIRMLLKPEGEAVIECPYLADLVDHCEFDTIYHQHLCYFSVTALDHLFRRHGLILVDVERTRIHGGSLRLFIRHQGKQSDRVAELLCLEHDRGMSQSRYYEQFSSRVESIRSRLVMILENIKLSGKSIAGYAAAAKGTTLLAFCQVDNSILDYIVDLSDFKNGRYMPGNHIPIYSPRRLDEAFPDYLLILAWNFAAEIMQEQHAYHDHGGRFIIPIPTPVIV